MLFLYNYFFEDRFCFVRKMSFALKKAFTRTVRFNYPDLRAKARSESSPTDENLKFLIFMNSDGI